MDIHFVHNERNDYDDGDGDGGGSGGRAGVELDNATHNDARLSCT